MDSLKVNQPGWFALLALLVAFVLRFTLITFAPQIMSNTRPGIVSKAYISAVTAGSAALPTVVALLANAVVG